MNPHPQYSLPAYRTKANSSAGQQIMIAAYLLLCPHLDLLQYPSQAELATHCTSIYTNYHFELFFFFGLRSLCKATTPGLAAM